jgi:hypothetical protein
MNDDNDEDKEEEEDLGQLTIPKVGLEPIGFSLSS